MSARWAFSIQVRRIGIFVKSQLCYFIEKFRRSGIFVADNATIFHTKLHRSNTSSGIKSDFGPLGLFDSGSQERHFRENPAMLFHRKAP